MLRCSLFLMLTSLTLFLLLREIEEPWKQITGSQLSMMPLFLLSYISGLYPYPRGRLVTKLLPYITVAILFVLFILYNGSIVVGNVVTALLGVLVYYYTVQKFDSDLDKLASSLSNLFLLNLFCLSVSHFICQRFSSSNLCGMC